MADPASLQNLHDVIKPAAVGFWPPADGVWIFVGLALLWALVGGVIVWFRYRQNAYRRKGMRELVKIRAGLGAQNGEKSAVLAVSVLLKRVALTAYSREKVASLSGEKWLSFLDETMTGGQFAKTGKLLSEGIYQPAGGAMEISTRHVEELCVLAGKWIREHPSVLPKKDDEHPSE
jgi:hypothetical protein